MVVCFASSWRNIGYGVGAATGIAGVLFILGKVPGFSLFTGRQPQLLQAGTASLTTPYSICKARWEGEKCVLSSNSQVGKTIPITGCTLGELAHAKRRVLVIGNSFPTAFAHAFDRLVSRDHYAVTITSSWGASPVREIPNHGAWDKASNCYWSKTVLSLAGKPRKGGWI